MLLIFSLYIIKNTKIWACIGAFGCKIVSIQACKQISVCVSVCLCQGVMKWVPALWERLLHPTLTPISPFSFCFRSCQEMLYLSHTWPLTHTHTHRHTNADDTICHSAMIQEGGGRCEKAHPDCTNTHTRPAAPNNSHQVVMLQTKHQSTKKKKCFLEILTHIFLIVPIFIWWTVSQIQKCLYWVNSDKKGLSLFSLNQYLWVLWSFVYFTKPAVNSRAEVPSHQQGRQICSVNPSISVWLDSLLQYHIAIDLVFFFLLKGHYRWIKNLREESFNHVGNWELRLLKNTDLVC